MNNYDRDSWGLGTYLSIYKRDNFTCQDCGRVWKDGDVFNIHHIVPVSKGGGDEHSNLILLCKPCHMKRHTKPSNILPSYREMLQNYENFLGLPREDDLLELTIQQTAGLLQTSEKHVRRLTRMEFFPSNNQPEQFKRIDYRGLYDWLRFMIGQGY